MNTFLAHLIVSVSMLFVVSLLTVGACLALHTISKKEPNARELPEQKAKLKPVADIEDIDIGSVFKNVKRTK